MFWPQHHYYDPIIIIFIKIRKFKQFTQNTSKNLLQNKALQIRNNMLVWTSLEKQGISKMSGARKQSGMNCKQFFEKGKNSLNNYWQPSRDMLLYNTSSARGNQLRQRLLIKRFICPALGLELITYLGTEWFDKVLKKSKKVLDKQNWLC